MSTLAQVTAAPSPVTIGGKEYQASPLTLFDFGALEETVKAEIIASAALAAQKLDPSLFDRMMAAASRSALGVSYTSPEMMAYLRSFRGMCSMVALSLKRKHPEVTEKQIADAAKGDPAQFGEVVDSVMRISGFAEDEEKPLGNSGAGGAAVTG